MAPRKCCCNVGCPIGDDDFNRADSLVPGPKWKLMSGTGSIVGNKIEVDGVVATTLCHPPSAVNGSYIATFRLINLRTVSLFEVGVGDPNTSTYYVRFEPSLMDTIDAKITITVVGSYTETFDFAWPGGYAGSDNEIDATVCYLPGAILRGSIGVPPPVDSCIPATGDDCYMSGPDPVGGFSLKKGHFDNWNYETTILDIFSCSPCGCFCFKRSGALKEFACFPASMCLNFEVTEGFCPELDGKVITMTQGNLQPNDGHPEKKSWFSAVQTCGGNQYAFVLDCTTITKDGTNWFIALTLRITGSNYADSNIIFNWIDPSVGLSTRNADYATSTCDPLNLVYPGLLVNSFFAPCGYPGEFGHYLFCCPDAGCEPTPMYVAIALTVTVCP